MPEYRVFTMNGNRIAGPADIIECETDQEAIEKARQMIDKNVGELARCAGKKCELRASSSFRKEAVRVFGFTVALHAATRCG